MELFDAGLSQGGTRGKGPLYWDASMLSDDDLALIRRVLPDTLRPFDEAGIDVRARLLQFTPVVEISSPTGNGGIRLFNTRCETSLPGLYTAGACCWNPPHGTYSVGGVNMAFNNVGGYRAEENAAKRAKSLGEPNLKWDQIEELRREAVQPLENKRGSTPDNITSKVHEIVLPAERSIFKNKQRIDKLLDRLRGIKAELPQMWAQDVHELVKANEVRNFVSMTELVYVAAGIRDESRDCHYREEFPYRDDENWLRWIILSRSAGGTNVDIVQVPLERYPVKPIQRGKIPHPVQFSSKGLGKEWHADS